MRFAAIIAILFALAACGVEGPPETRQGVTVGGEVRIGVSGEL
jgi:hypothetical protein